MNILNKNYRKCVSVFIIIFNGGDCLKSYLSSYPMIIIIIMLSLLYDKEASVRGGSSRPLIRNARERVDIHVLKAGVKRRLFMTNRNEWERVVLLTSTSVGVSSLSWMFPISTFCYLRLIGLPSFTDASIYVPCAV